MAVTRADTLSGSRKQKEFFSDFPRNFNKSPFGGDLGRVLNNDSINQSLRNLIKTNLGERLFQPYVGSDVYKMLFEHNASDNLNNVEAFIKNTIVNNDSRVNLIGVEAKISDQNENEVIISIYYNLINNPEPTTLNILLKRVR